MEYLVALPVDGRIHFARVVARVAAANAAVPPNEFHARAVAVGALLEVHLPGMVAERAEITKRVRVTHRDPFQIFENSGAFTFAEVRDVELQTAIVAGRHVVVDAIGKAQRLPALSRK